MSRPGDQIGQPPYVSVVVPVHNGAVRLESCLGALARQTYPGERYEIVVVDNGSTDDIAAVARPYPAAILVSEPRRGSYAARNAGIAVAKGTVVAFTDADCIPSADWLERGVERLLSRPSCGLLGGRIDVVLRDPEEPTAIELYDSVVYLTQPRYVGQLGFAATANLFTRRTVIDAVGLFDPELPSGGDLEWGRRVGAAGYELLYAEDCRVAHPARRSFAEFAGKAKRIGRGMGAMSRRRQPGVSRGSATARRLRGLALLLPPVRAARANRAATLSSGQGMAARVVLLTVLDHYLRLWARAGMRLSSGRRSRAAGRAGG